MTNRVPVMKEGDLERAIAVIAKHPGIGPGKLGLAVTTTNTLFSEPQHYVFFGANLARELLKRGIIKTPTQGKDTRVKLEYRLTYDALIKEAGKIT